MYIYVKLLLGNLNLGLCYPHPTSIYTYKVTIVPGVCDGNYHYLKAPMPINVKIKLKWTTSFCKSQMVGA